jgi:hypothetical protein
MTTFRLKLFGYHLNKPPAVNAPEVYETKNNVVPKHGRVSAKYIQAHEMSCKEGQESYATIFKVTA